MKSRSTPRITNSPAILALSKLNDDILAKAFQETLEEDKKAHEKWLKDNEGKTLVEFELDGRPLIKWSK